MKVYQIHSLIDGADRIRFIGVVGDQAVCCCELDLLPGNQPPHIALLYAVWVEPAYRGRYYSKQIIGHALDAAVAHKMTGICLGVHRDNQPAINLYEKLGFTYYEAYNEVFLGYHLQLFPETKYAPDAACNI